MLAVGTFVAGFASGWLARGTVDSSRQMVVALVATYYKAADRMRRVVAIEREHLEDLVAEGRTKFQTDRARKAAAAANTQRATEVPRQGRAA